MAVKPSEYFTGDNRLVYTQYGPMSQRYAMKSIYNNVAPASGFQYVEDDKYNDILNKYDPSGLGFDWTDKAKSSGEFVKNYFSGAGLNWDPAGQNALAAGVNYGSGANTSGIYHTMPTKPVAWGDIANQVSYNPTLPPAPVQNTPVPVGAVGAGAVDARGNIRGGSTPAATTTPPDPNRYNPPPRDYNANPLTPEEISALNAPMGSSRVAARSQYQVPAVTARNASTTPTAGPPASYNLPTGYTFVRPGKAGGSWQIVKDSQGNEFIYDPSTGSLEPNDYAHTMGSSGGTTPPGGYDQFGVPTPGGQYDFMGTQLKPGDVGYVATPSTNDRSLWTRPGASSTASVARSDTTPFDPTAIQSGPNLFGNASEIDPAVLEARKQLLLANGGVLPGMGSAGGAPSDPGISYPPGADPNDPNRPGYGGGSLGAGAGASFKDYGQLSKSYGFEFPLVEQFDPTQIDKIPSVKWLLDNVDAETRNALLAQGRLSGDFGINAMTNAKYGVLSDQLNQAYNRYIQDQGNARAWGTFGQGEDQRQFQNMLNLAGMGQQSASQAASMYDSWGKNSAALFDEQGTYIGEAGNQYAKNAASTVQNYVTTQIGLDAQHAGKMINMLGNYGMNLSDIMMWMADPTSATTLAALKAQTQAGTGQNIATMMAQILPSIIEYAKKQQK